MDVASHPTNDIFRRSAGGKYLADTGGLQPGNIVFRDHAAAENLDVAGAFSVEKLRNLGAPDRIESPTQSTSSWIAAETICSGVWCRPV